jgi:erythromycin esterase
MRILLFLVFCLFTISSDAQIAVQKYVKQHTVAIKTIEPDSLDFSDLTAIGSAIGDSRIVMLGEQDHGDAPTFLAKTRLIKYLHEQKGFNLFAFEGDFFALNHGWSNPDSKEDKEGLLRYNLPAALASCAEIKTLLYQYIPLTRQGNPNDNTYFNMKGIIHANQSAVWTNVYDGIFYIRDMYPCDKIIR